MITVRKSEDRGQSSIDWLQSKHSFSFGHYYDPNYMGSGPLRVINEDVVAPGAGFPSHNHDNMEIISYVIEGALEHKDSLGTGSVIRPGDVQRMSAGTGIQHSEYNPSDTEPVHFLQIWIEPEEKGLQPSYEQKQFDRSLQNGLMLIGSRDGRDGSVQIHRDLELYAGHFHKGVSLPYRLADGHQAWLQVIDGELMINDYVLQAGDGIEIKDKPEFSISVQSDAHVLLFDMVG